MTEYTEGQWYFKQLGDTFVVARKKEPHTYIAQLIHGIPTKEQEANVERIVLCCNAHDGLVEALDKINNKTGDWLSGEEDNMSAEEVIQFTHDVLGDAFAALAEGGA